MPHGVGRLGWACYDHWRHHCHGGPDASYDCPAAGPYYRAAWRPVSRDEEAAVLEDEARALEEELGQIKKGLDEIKR